MALLVRPNTTSSTRKSRSVPEKVRTESYKFRGEGFQYLEESFKSRHKARSGSPSRKQKVNLSVKVTGSGDDNPQEVPPREPEPQDELLFDHDFEQSDSFQRDEPQWLCCDNTTLSSTQDANSPMTDSSEDEYVPVQHPHLLRHGDQVQIKVNEEVLFILGAVDPSLEGKFGSVILDAQHATSKETQHDADHVRVQLSDGTLESVPLFCLHISSGLWHRRQQRRLSMERHQEAPIGEQHDISMSETCPPSMFDMEM